MVGMPIFVMVVVAPWIFLCGLMEVYKSSVWTLTYRGLPNKVSLDLVPAEVEPIEDEEIKISKDDQISDE
jgi:hypothetical protein